MLGSQLCYLLLVWLPPSWLQTNLKGLPYFSLDVMFISNLVGSTFLWWGCGRMEATSGTAVVEVYLYNRNRKACDLKMIIYIFGQLLGAPAMLCSGFVWGSPCWAGAGRERRWSWSWDAQHSVYNGFGFSRHPTGSNLWAAPLIASWGM